MKLRLLSLLCVPLLFAGCESPAGVAHYRYGNLTDRIIQVEAPDADDYWNPCTFELAPGRNMNSHTFMPEVYYFLRLIIVSMSRFPTENGKSLLFPVRTKKGKRLIYMIWIRIR